MNSDFASYTLTNMFWKPKTGVQEQLWVRAVTPGDRDGEQGPPQPRDGQTRQRHCCDTVWAGTTAGPQVLLYRARAWLEHPHQPLGRGERLWDLSVLSGTCQ